MYEKCELNHPEVQNCSVSLDVTCVFHWGSIALPQLPLLLGEGRVLLFFDWNPQSNYHTFTFIVTLKWESSFSFDFKLVIKSSQGLLVAYSEPGKGKGYF